MHLLASVSSPESMVVFELMPTTVELMLFPISALEYEEVGRALARRGRTQTKT